MTSVEIEDCHNYYYHILKRLSGSDALENRKADDVGYGKKFEISFFFFLFLFRFVFWATIFLFVTGESKPMLKIGNWRFLNWIKLSKMFTDIFCFHRFFQIYYDKCTCLTVGDNMPLIAVIHMNILFFKYLLCT